MTSYERYAEIRDAKGLTDYKVARATGNGTATFTNWKQGKYTPKQDKIEAIADFLGVQPEDIIERPNAKVKALHAQEKVPEFSDVIRETIESAVNESMKILNLDQQAMLIARLTSKLNQEGQAKVFGYIQDLLLIDKYKSREEDVSSLEDAERAYEKAFGIRSEQETPVLNTTEDTENKNVG